MSASCLIAQVLTDASPGTTPKSLVPCETGRAFASVKRWVAEAELLGRESDAARNALKRKPVATDFLYTSESIRQVEGAAPMSMTNEATAVFNVVWLSFLPASAEEVFAAYKILLVAPPRTTRAVLTVAFVSKVR